MKLSQNFFNHNLNKNFSFEKNPQIAVAVSGGPDSICLTLLLKNWIKISKGKMIALIIDHKLRDESSKEANFVKKYLTDCKIDSKIIKINKFNIDKRSMKEARDNRFEKLTNYCKKNKIFHLFLGHHFDDNLETYLLRRVAGSNFEGLRSMQNKLFMKNLQIIRPLLDYQKKEIIQYNNVNKIKSINDPSNKNTKYSRVLIRNFLSENVNYKKIISNEFNDIIKYYPFYKKMIFQAVNEIIKNISKNEIIIDSNIFLKKDIEMQAKIIEIIYKFLRLKKYPPRYKKNLQFLSELQNKTVFKTNLAGIIVKKDEKLIYFRL